MRHLFILYVNRRIYLKLKKLVLRLTAILLILSFSSTTAFAGLNLGNDDGTNFKGGTSNNYWGVYTDGGIPLNDTEGLRVTVYNAKTNDKAFNTIDITGNANISAASAMQYFSDGNELISKTTWLNYVSSTYNSVSESDMSKFNSAVMSRASSGGGYKSQYIPDLASIDIVSVNNSSNLAAIKEALSSVNFLKNLCDLIGGGLTYEDIAQGKYKIAFEPVAYFRYNGQNWAMSATECGLLNKYMKNYFTAGWNSTNNLRALLGPLTHSNLPRSAFLENKDLGIPVYSPSSSDYYNGNSSYNSDTCIIRCMGIGVLSAEEPPDDDIGEESTSSAEYHTDTDVYTSFYAINVGDVPFIGESSFSIYDSGGETPRKYEQLKEENKKLIHATGSQSGVTYYYAYTSTELETVYADDDEKIDVFIDNPAYVPDEDGEMPYVSPYVRLGSFKHGDEMRLSNTFKRLRSTRGEGYIDISVAVLVVMILLVAVIKIAPVFITKMTINNYANELCREAEIAGRVGTETTTRLDRLNESHPDLNPTITWSKTGNIQIGNTFTVTVSTTYDFSFFVFSTTPITISATAEGTSEVFWK